jgi:hypothetical protein
MVLIWPLTLLSLTKAFGESDPFSSNPTTSCWPFLKGPNDPRSSLTLLILARSGRAPFVSPDMGDRPHTLCTRYVQPL